MAPGGPVEGREALSSLEFYGQKARNPCTPISTQLFNASTITLWTDIGTSLRLNIIFHRKHKNRRGDHIPIDPVV